MSKRNGTTQTTRADIRFVPCQVEPGMFREEWLVYLNVVDPKNPKREIKVQSLVDARDVRAIHGTPKRKSPAKGLLRVTLVRHEADYAWIVLPQPATPTGENVLVRKDALEQEAAV